MSFCWNAFGPVNLALDLAITFTFYALAFVNRRLQPAIGLLAVCRQALLGSLAVWALAGVLVGGIIGFSLIARAGWTLFTAAIPLMLVFFAARSGKTALLAPALLLAVFKYYGEVYEPDNLEVRSASIAVEGLKGPVRVAHLSDLQTDGLRAMHRKARLAVNAFEPDLIFFTGDLLNHPSLEPEIQAYLRGFRSGSGSFAVGGNVDYRLDLGGFYKNTGFALLDGDFRKIKLDGGTVGLAGLGLDDFGDKRLLTGLLGKIGKADAVLLLSHVPDAMKTVEGLAVTALFAGHTHGGQVRLPWAGPLVTMSGVNRVIAAGGIHKAGKLHIVVSRGLGLEGHVAPRVRTFCRPQILLLELKPGRL